MGVSIDMVRKHPHVATVSDERDDGGEIFVYLKEGYEWSEQRCFGGTILECWSLVKESKWVGERSDGTKLGE